GLRGAVLRDRRRELFLLAQSVRSLQVTGRGEVTRQEGGGVEQAGQHRQRREHNPDRIPMRGQTRRRLLSVLPGHSFDSVGRAGRGGSQNQSIRDQEEWTGNGGTDETTILGGPYLAPGRGG